MLIVYSLYFALAGIVLYRGFSGVVSIIYYITFSYIGFPNILWQNLVLSVLIQIPAGILLIFTWHGFVYSKKYIKITGVVGCILTIIYILYYILIYVIYGGLSSSILLFEIPDIGLLIFSIFLIVLILKPRVINKQFKIS